MKTCSKVSLFVPLLAVASLSAATTLAQVPLAIHAPGAAIAAIFHAEGLQLYECSPNTYGQLFWQTREPIATLIFEGNTVGRHYAGPHWEHLDGSIVRAQAVGSTPGKTLNDLPWLKLDAVSLKRKGVFSGVTTVQRVNTQGGVAQGPCEEPGSFLRVPYSADYVFLRQD